MNWSWRRTQSNNIELTVKPFGMKDVIIEFGDTVVYKQCPEFIRSKI